MSTKYNLAVGLLASLALTISQVAASDFAERMAAWQSAAPPEQTTASPPVARPVRSALKSAPAAAQPAPTSSAPPAQYAPTPHAVPHAIPHEGHGPGCATCGAGPTMGTHAFGDPFYADGACGGYGSCCGPCGGCGGCFLPFLNCLFNPCRGSGGCGSCGSWDGGMPCCNTLVWARAEVLLWWRQGNNLPALVTTDPVSESSTTAGILPNAQTLFGGERVDSDMQVGGRFDLGWWCDPRQCFGYGWRFYGLGDDATEFNITSLENPVLAIPFFDDTNDVNNALLVAYPGLRTGSINITNSSQVIGNDLYVRMLLCRDCNCRMDFITGWNYTRFDDELQISSQQTVTQVGGNIPVGTVTDIDDRFDVRNEFNGAILGLQWERNCGCWDTRVLARMSIGNMREEISISGSTVVAVPGSPVSTTNGGLFTATSNIGSQSRDEFTAITEVGFTLAYRWGPCTQLTAGYSFIYWNDVLTAGDSIDTNVGSGSPQFTFTHSDFWVQGLNLGLVRQF